MLRETVVFLAVTSLALAAIQQVNLQPKPDRFKDVEGCYVEDLDDVIPPGGSAPCPKHCMGYRCGTTYLQIETCGVLPGEPTCTLVENHSKPYPACCPALDCP